MPLSVAVVRALKASEELTDWIDAQHPSKIRNVGGNMMAVAPYSLALEHRNAIALLVHRGAWPSAFALQRSVFEAYVRGSWAQHCATEQEQETAFETGVTPGLDTMVRRLGKRPDTRGTYGKAKSILWEPFSDLAHGGMRQVLNWFGPEGIAPQRHDAEVVHMLAVLDMYGLLAAMSIAASANSSLEPYQLRAESVLERLKATTASAKKRTGGVKRAPAG